MILFILYYLPMVICIGGSVFMLMDDMDYQFAFIALIVSCIPILNIFFAAFLLEEMR